MFVIISTKTGLRQLFLATFAVAHTKVEQSPHLWPIPRATKTGVEMLCHRDSNTIANIEITFKLDQPQLLLPELNCRKQNFFYFLYQAQ